MGGHNGLISREFCADDSDDPRAQNKNSGSNRDFLRVAARAGRRKSGGRVELNRSETAQVPGFVEARQCPRFKLDVEIQVYSRSSGLVTGRTVDLSESGIAAMLKMEVPLGEVVQLEFTLPLGQVEIGALVRQQQAFRYGFQFVEQGPARELIARTCRDLSLEQLLNDPIR